jgi:peptidoglycan/LPS O-acetylase OafA/YrhL
LSAAAERPSHFRPDIEGLRAIAVMAVLLFHMQVPGFSGGFTGVDMFNVNSRILITGLQVREVGHTGRVDLPTFYFRRARRLLPAALTVIIVTLIASAYILSPIRFPSVAGDGAASAFYVANIRFALEGTDYLASAADPSPYQHFWSLGVEEQFYLVWPLLVLLASKLVGVRNLIWVLGAVVIASFLCSWVITDVDAPWAFFSLPTRAWQLGAGGLVALGIARWVPRKALPYVGLGGLVLVLAGVTLLNDSVPYPGTAALIPTLGTMMLIVGAGDAAGALARGLGSWLPRSIGGISYSIYLWHWPLLILVPIALSDDSLGLRLLLGASSIGFAIVSTKVIEAPFRFGRISRTPALRGVAVGLAASLLVGTTALAAGSFAPDPLEDVSGPNVVQPTERPRPTRRPRPSATVVVETPTARPTAKPTAEPTVAATDQPTPEPTEAITPEPSAPPTAEPTVAATDQPTPGPTEAITPEPSAPPTAEPTEAITPEPSAPPTAVPTPTPTEQPTATPAPTSTSNGVAVATPGPTATTAPTAAASIAPTPAPTLAPLPDPVTSGPLPQGLTPRLRDIKADLPAGYADGCRLGFDDEESGDCVYGYPDGSSTVVLYGDSHAQQWLPAIEEVGFVRDWRVVGLTKSACPPADITVWLDNKKRAYRECDAWRENAMARIAAEQPAIVFVAGYHIYKFMDGDERVDLASDLTTWGDALTRTIRDIQATGAEVILIADTPQLGVVPDECLADHRDAIEGCLQKAADVVDAGYAQLERDVAAATGAHLLSLTDVNCPDGTCPLVFGTTPVYRDDQHLTATFARSLAPTIDTWLDMEDR